MIMDFILNNINLNVFLMYILVIWHSGIKNKLFCFLFSSEDSWYVTGRELNWKLLDMKAMISKQILKKMKNLRLSEDDTGTGVDYNEHSKLTEVIKHCVSLFDCIFKLLTRNSEQYWECQSSQL